MKKKRIIIPVVLIAVIIISVIVFTSFAKQDYIVSSHNTDWINTQITWDNFHPVDKSLDLFKAELTQSGERPEDVFDNIYFNQISMDITLKEQGPIINDIEMYAYKLYAQKDKHKKFEFFSLNNSELKLQGYYVDADKYDAQYIMDTSVTAYQATLISRLRLAESVFKEYQGDYIHMASNEYHSGYTDIYLINTQTIEKVSDDNFDFPTLRLCCSVFTEGVSEEGFYLFISVEDN